MPWKHDKWPEVLLSILPAEGTEIFTKLRGLALPTLK